MDASHSEGSVIPVHVAAGFLGQPGIGCKVFLPQPDVLAQVLCRVRMDDVTQVIAMDAGAPGAAAKGQRHVPDLPALAVLGAESSGLVLDGAHRRPRSRSAFSISVRSWPTVTARTTSGGLVCGRRA